MPDTPNHQNENFHNQSKGSDKTPLYNSAAPQPQALPQRLCVVDYIKSKHEQEAEMHLRELILQLSILRLRAAAGGDPTEIRELERRYHQHFSYTVALIAAGLETGRVVF